MSDSLTDREWQAILPGINWRKPISVDTAGAHGYACRLCLARHGLKAAEAGKLPQTFEEFHQHLAEHHPTIK